jgi:hypothetical protein
MRESCGVLGFYLVIVVFYKQMQDILKLCNAIKVRIIYRLMVDAMLFKQFNMKKIELQCAKCSKECLLA